jgi:hypothetical protein
MPAETLGLAEEVLEPDGAPAGVGVLVGDPELLEDEVSVGNVDAVDDGDVEGENEDLMHHKNTEIMDADRAASSRARSVRCIR